MGKRFLFEDLVIDGATKALALAMIFEQTALSGDAGASDSLLGYGRWVKRITLKQKHNWLGEPIIPCLERLLGHCINLQALIILAGIPDVSMLSRLFQHSFTHSLRQISLPGLARGGEGSDMPRIVDLPFKLDWISFPSSWIPIIFSGTSTTESLPPASIYNLSVLDITIGTVPLPAWDLPALRYLSITHLYENEIPPLLPFMAVNGPRLLGLTLGTSQRCDTWYRLLDHTPNLTSVVVDDHDIETLRPPGSPEYRSITHIGLITIDYSREADARRIQGGLTYILGHTIFPHLRVVRILAEKVPDTITEQWAPPIATAAQYGVRLEDRYEKLLSVH